MQILYLDRGNADATVGSSTGKAWNYDDEVSYPFGYGLSYTTFETKVLSTVLKDNKIVVETETINTGDTYSGKEVVQIYVSCPDGELKKEAQRLNFIC